jgi:hypothetical protein
MWIAMCIARDHKSVNTILGEVFPHSHGTQYLLYAECRASVPNAEPSRAEPNLPRLALFVKESIHYAPVPLGTLSEVWMMNQDTKGYGQRDATETKNRQ